MALRTDSVSSDQMRGAQHCQFWLAQQLTAVKFNANGEGEPDYRRPFLHVRVVYLLTNAVLD